LEKLDGGRDEGSSQHKFRIFIKSLWVLC